MCHSPRPSTPRSAIKEVEEELDDEPAPASEKPRFPSELRRSALDTQIMLSECRCNRREEVPTSDS